MAGILSQSRLEPMNASPYHSKVKVSLTFSDSLFLAGGYITGKMDLECRADRGLNLGVIMVELFGIQELASRDHSATSTFIHLARRFQGPSLPLSNAVHPFILVLSDHLPSHYYPARKGVTSFHFRFALPSNSPSSIDFGNGLAKLRYEVRASVEVDWKGEIRLITDKKEADVVETYIDTQSRIRGELAIGENGKLWVHGRVMNKYVVTGQGVCVELFVRNYTSKKVLNLSVSFMRYLHIPSILPDSPLSESLLLSDRLLHIPFKGPEYIVYPGTEGTASLVFNVPKDARGVKGGPRDGRDVEFVDGNGQYSESEGLFEVKCTIEVSIGMGLGSRDVVVELPVSVFHPVTFLDHTPSEAEYLRFTKGEAQHQVHEQISCPRPMIPCSNASPPPMAMPSPAQQYIKKDNPSPASEPYLSCDQNAVLMARNYVHLPAAPLGDYLPEQYYVPSEWHQYIQTISGSQGVSLPPRNPIVPNHSLISDSECICEGTSQPNIPDDSDINGVSGMGIRVSRISNHLRTSSRYRSISPQSHRSLMTSSNTTIKDHLTTIKDHLTPLVGPSRPIQRSASTDDILSPRPMLSPRHSSYDEFASLASEKSPRIAALERLATDEAGHKIHLNATKMSLALASENSEELVEEQQGSDEDAVSVETPKPPPSPHLQPLIPVSSNLYELGNCGLVALERKLLEQVGTRKHKTTEKGRDKPLPPIIVLPIDQQLAIPVIDSAISSLFLPEAAADKSQSTTQDYFREATTKMATESPAVDEDSSAERERRSEARRLRKAATGRVAAWLDGIDTEVTEKSHLKVESTAAMVVDDPQAFNMKDISEGDVPNTSSGFTLHSKEDEDRNEILRTRLKEGFNSHLMPQSVVSKPSDFDEEVKAAYLSFDSPHDIYAKKEIQQRALHHGEVLGGSPPIAKYDVKSARGGRGGR